MKIFKHYELLKHDYGIRHNVLLQSLLLTHRNLRVDHATVAEFKITVNVVNLVCQGHCLFHNRYRLKQKRLV